MINTPSHDLIGTLAATCTTLAFVPQVWQIWRTRNARDISLPMYCVLTVGILLWLSYGLMLNATPVIVANIVTLGLALSVIVMKLRFRT
ncbi:MAG: SemiSWEET family sugar transporter [Betaproteobacteria bacterium]|nr:SemiSWEET family sugar transporter [Betaproteobacteria bacterium]